jgi:hypothetical protein
MIGLVGVFIGGIITWLVTNYYYIRAAQDLKSEASELKRLNILMLRGMENAGLVKLNRDKEGNIVGFTIELSASIRATSKTSTANLSVE